MSNEQEQATNTLSTEEKPMDFATPGWKCKEHYKETLLDDSSLATPGKGQYETGFRNATSNNDLVVLPSLDSQEFSEEEQIAQMMTQ